MSLLKEIIINRIKSEGPISFEAFMDMALYYPEHGYYMKDLTRIGRAGDFYTSPHLHKIFGAMIGRQMEEMWNIMGKPDVFHIVEMGAGMGYLANDLLEYLKEAGCRRRDAGEKGEEAGGESEMRGRGETEEKNFFEYIKYTIVEMNPSLEARQKELLSEYEDKVRWVSCLREMEPAAGCFVSNELLDAFPVILVEMDDELKEVFVGEENDNLIELKRSCSDYIINYFKDVFIEFPIGYRTEANMKIRDWLDEVDSKLTEGFILTIDYGYPAQEYYSEERSRGTLLCYQGHKLNEDPYQYVGEQDITAHVNFSSLKKWGEDVGLKTIGFCQQGTYLVSLGIDEAIKELYGESPDAFEIAKIKGLILPGGMGESHKVMVQYKGSAIPELRGFSLRNQNARL